MLYPEYGPKCGPFFLFSNKDLVLKSDNRVSNKYLLSGDKRNEKKIISIRARLCTDLCT